MRSLAIVVFAGLCALACGFAVPTQSKVADKEFLANQAKFFELLQNVHQHDGILQHLHEHSHAFKFAEHADYFTKAEVVEEFVHYLEKGQLIGRDVIFNYHNSEHLRQAIALFKVFYYTKDFAAFYETLVWARFHTNPGMFVYALTVVMLHHPELAGYEMPAPYEIFPHYYFNAETIQFAQQQKMEGYAGQKKIEGVYTHTILSNYTDVHYAMNGEQKLAYFTEDIGLNAWYYYLHMDYPFWMDGTEFGLAKDRRGEFVMYMHQQLLARYYMERLSNGLGAVPEFSFMTPIKTGYASGLRHYNGQFFPQRENFYHAYKEGNYKHLEQVYDIERHIRDSIAAGFVTLPNGTHFDITRPEAIDQLGNLIQGNADTVNKRFYGYFFLVAKTLLSGQTGFAHKHHFQHYAPAAIEQIETTLRDPMFYQLNKRAIRWYWQFKNQLPSYTRSEIQFDGVRVEKVEMDKLETFFDKHDADITNAVNVEPFDFKTYKAATEYQKFGKIAHYAGEELLVKARQARLNHQPFSIRLSVVAEKPQPSVVRVYMAPKYDEFGHKIELTENRENFHMLDAFKYDLVAGKNVIERASHQFTWYVKDRTTFYDLYKWVMTATKGETKFTLDMSEAHNGLPERLMLPKGTKSGMPIQFFFIVSPYHKPAVEQHTGYDAVISSGVGSGARFTDSLPFGYPFDRKIDVDAWYTPNMFFYEVPVYHRKEQEINSVHYKAE